MANLGWKLRTLRHERGMRLREVARLSGVGVKTISSFETGDRLASMKVGQLQRLLRAYGVSEADFFGETASEREPGSNARAGFILRTLSDLPESLQEALIAKIQLMVETAGEVHALSRPRPWSSQENDWQLLNSHN